MCQALCHVGMCVQCTCVKERVSVCTGVCACVFEDERVAVEYTLPI